MRSNTVPRVGVGVIVLKGNKVLLGKRKNSHGPGTWNFPGGHLDFGETLEDCARREVLEESGVIVKNIRKGPYTNDFFESEGKHYITIFMLADWESGEAEILEPDKCDGWAWFEWDDLPQPRFLPLENLLAEGYSPVVFEKK